MLEFLLVFAVTFLVILGVTMALVFGKAPVYRPTKEEIQVLLTSLLDGTLAEQEWQFFLDMPIRHDAELETIRERCLQLQETQALRPKNQKARLQEGGLIRIRYILNQLEEKGGRAF